MTVGPELDGTLRESPVASEGVGERFDVANDDDPVDADDAKRAGVAAADDNSVV